MRPNRWAGVVALGILELLGSIQPSAAQGIRAYDARGKVAYTLAGVDSAQVLGGLLLGRSAGTWHLYRSADGTQIAEAVLPQVRQDAFGWQASTVAGRKLLVCGDDRAQVSVADAARPAGQGWMLAFQNQTCLALHRSGGQPQTLPQGTDTATALAGDLLAYGTQVAGNRRWGLWQPSEGGGHARLPAIYDSICGPVGGLVLAFAQGKAQLYTPEGKPVGPRRLEQAAVLNAAWLGYRQGGAWTALHLPTLQMFACAAAPVAVGRQSCLLPQAKGVQVRNGAGQLVPGVKKAIEQAGTGQLVVERKGQWYLLGHPGLASTLLKVPQVQALGPFADGLAPVQLAGGLWGFIDRLGFVRIAPRYRAVRAFAEGAVAVQIGSKWGLIDAAERLLVQPWADSARFDTALAGWLLAAPGRVQIWSRQGKLEGLTAVLPAGDKICARQGSAWGLLSAGGLWQIPAWYDVLLPAAPGQFVARRGAEWAVLNEAGLPVLPWGYKRPGYDAATGLYFVNLPVAAQSQ